MINMNNTEKEITAIDVQIGASIASIIAVIISITLLYNQKLDLKNKQTFFNPKQTQKISEFARDILLIVAIVFLLVNYQLYNISKEEGEDLKPYELQIVASYLSIIAALIALYVVRNPANRGEIADVENPII